MDGAVDNLVVYTRCMQQWWIERGRREDQVISGGVSLSTVVLIGIGMVPSIIDVWGYDREFCSSSSSSSPFSSSSSSSPSTNVTQKLK